jgi:hypothetical protein
MMSDIDDLTAFGAGTHLLKTLILELRTAIGLGWNNQAKKMTNMLT